MFVVKMNSNVYSQVRRFNNFFNLLAAVAIFLPLEMAFGILEKISHWLVSPMLATGDMSMGGLKFTKPITKPVVSAIKEPIRTFGDTVGGRVERLSFWVSRLFS